MCPQFSEVGQVQRGAEEVSESLRGSPGLEVPLQPLQDVLHSYKIPASPQYLESSKEGCLTS